MVAAIEEIERNLALAVDLMQQSLSFGVPAGLSDFLSRLSGRDSELAEQQTIVLSRWNQRRLATSRRGSDGQPPCSVSRKFSILRK